MNDAEAGKVGESTIGSSDWTQRDTGPIGAIESAIAGISRRSVELPSPKLCITLAKSTMHSTRGEPIHRKTDELAVKGRISPTGYKRTLPLRGIAILLFFTSSKSSVLFTKDCTYNICFFSDHCPQYVSARQNRYHQCSRTP